MTREERRALYVAAAKDGCGYWDEPEIDDDAKVSGCGGAYVQVWVWVPKREVKQFVEERARRAK